VHGVPAPSLQGPACSPCATPRTWHACGTARSVFIAVRCGANALNVVVDVPFFSSGSSCCLQRTSHSDELSRSACKTAVHCHVAQQCASRLLISHLTQQSSSCASILLVALGAIERSHQSS
jgi:hypothetical protein